MKNSKQLRQYVEEAMESYGGRNNVEFREGPEKNIPPPYSYEISSWNIWDFMYVNGSKVLAWHVEVGIAAMLRVLVTKLFSST